MKEIKINPNSTVGKCLNIYKRFDKQALMYNSVCKPDCCFCCYDYFYISSAEFYTIMQYILQKNNYKEILKTVKLNAEAQKQELKLSFYDEYKKIYSQNFNYPIEYYLTPVGNGRIQLKKPCIFLNAQNKCIIYKVRPLVCRQFGTIIDSRYENEFICSRAIYNIYLDYSKIDNSQNSNILLFMENQFVIPKPLLYWFSEIVPFLEQTDFQLVKNKCEEN